jgi:hypothetical protein
VLVPAVEARRPETLELHLVAADGRGNEVLEWASADRPREIALRYQPPVRWYRRWWIWAAAGGAVAIATGATVYLAGRGPPDTIDGVLDIR